MLTTIEVMLAVLAGFAAIGLVGATLAILLGTKSDAAPPDDRPTPWNDSDSDPV